MEKKMSVSRPVLTAGVRLFCVLSALMLLTGVLLPLQSEAGLRGELVRFHVVANSDSKRDQELKMEVRDLILELTREELAACGDRAEAAALLDAQKEMLMQRVRKFLKSERASYGASACLKTEYHEKKTYGDITLPAGEYLSFRVTLGAGEGKNFFCVLFPPLCTPIGEEKESEVLVRYGADAGGVRFFAPAEGRETRFFFADLFSRLFQM